MLSCMSGDGLVGSLLDFLREVPREVLSLLFGGEEEEEGRKDGEDGEDEEEEEEGAEGR